MDTLHIAPLLEKSKRRLPHRQDFVLAGEKANKPNSSDI